ncbi:hypothetical protein MMC10_008678 [Thelotrema lepadinum]|nr:hypothetical protein [Thelotrema lepadinum]
MPSYLGGAVQISLSHANLQGTLTENPIKRAGKETRENIDRTEVEFSNGVRFQELPVRSSDGLSLRFLGEEHDHMPFYMLKAGKSIHQPRKTSNETIAGIPFSESGHSSTFPKSPSFTQDMSPSSLERRALCLTVGMTAGSFLPQPSCTVPPGGKATIQDVKVDVFFNGERCACTFSPARTLPSIGKFKSLETYHGKRKALGVETPWIVVPAGQTADGSVRENKRSKWSNADQRWGSVNSLLLAEAEASAKDEQGKLTILGDYLHALANVKIPGDIQGLQSVNYGVLDVVLISGLGKKDEASEKYLTKPVSARLSRLDWGLAPATAQLGVKSRRGATLTTVKNRPRPEPGSINGVPQNKSTASGPTSTKTPIPSRIKRKPSLDMRTPTTIARSTQTSTQGQAATSTSTPDSTQMLDSPLVAKRRRILETPTDLNLPLRSVTPNRSIGTPGTARSGPSVQSQTTRVSQPMISPGDVQPNRVSTFRLPTEHPGRYPIPRKTPSQPALSRTQNYTTQAPQAQSRTLLNTPNPLPSNAKDSITVVAPPSNVPPPCSSQINEDCIITYDPKGVRQVRKERTGKFEESGVILGVRYIVLPI